MLTYFRGIIMTMQEADKEKDKKITIKGKVKWFSKQKGYGYITPEDGKDIFVHHSAIKGDDDKMLEAGQEVEFEIEQHGKHGSKAGLLTEKHKKVQNSHYDMGTDLEFLTKGLPKDEAQLVREYAVDIEKGLGEIRSIVRDINQNYSRSHECVQGLLKELRERGYKV